MDYKEAFWSLRKLRKSRMKGAGALAHSMTARLANKGSWLLDYQELAGGHQGREEAFVEPSPDVEQAEMEEVKNAEREEILKSFAKFAQEKTETRPEKKISFPGGELEVADKNKESSLDVKINAEVSPYILKRDLKEGEDLKILFIGEVPKDFEGEDTDLLSKMIGAMNFERGQFARAFIPKVVDEQERQNLWNDCASDICHLRPKVVISLGVFATSMLLGKKERLTRIHGKEFSLTLKGDELFNCSVFPIFHPDILNINPNMKRSAWMDLQEVMKFLVS